MSEKKSEENLNSISGQPDPNYWRSFEELHNDPQVLEARHHEFGNGVTDEFSTGGMSSLSRRKFLALLGASAALAGTACSDYRDKGEIVPYNTKPEEITIGRPNYYSSTCTACANACGIIIKTREGRPIKVDGNPDHPVNQGKICAKGQANILNLYDPERIIEPIVRKNSFSQVTTWKKADDEIIKALREAGSKEIAIISHTVISPSQKAVLDEFTAKYPTTKIYTYELFNDSIRNSAWQKCYGQGRFPLINWDKAKIIISLESDFLGIEGNKIETSRLFSSARDIKTKSFNRLYTIESSLSITGMNSDYRLRLKPESQLEFVLSLISELKTKAGINLSFATTKYSISKFAKKYNLNVKTLNHLVTDLAKNKGESLIYAGNSLPEDVHIAVNILNDALGNNTLYRQDASVDALMELASSKEIKDLVNKIDQGNVAVLINLDSNPVYHFSSELNLNKVLAKVPVKISLSERENETTQNCDYVLPINHNFESWGDGRTRTGVYSLQQPVIAPIHNTRQKESVILTWLNGDSSFYSDDIYHKYVQSNWEKNIYPKLNSKLDFKRFWTGALHDGVVLENSKAFTLPVLNSNSSALVNYKENNQEGITLILKESHSLGDGRFANNGWLQELPHPVSKITWDNYAAISDSTAKSLDVKNNDLLEVSVSKSKLTLPVFIQPGTADNVIVVELGYGRKNSGVVAEEVGFNANIFVSPDSDVSPWIIKNVTAAKVSGSYKLASTQEHHAFDNAMTKDIHKKRNIIQEATVAGYLSNPKIISENHHEELKSVYSPHPYNGVKWGMSIDLNKCTGCSECVVACNVENNIPVVGKDQVLVSREMQWLRIDRYYSGTVDEPSISTQPMLCQHCDQAPCENVCPVVATTHSPDGLNQMTYNRCVGTRYCSNNCPYKVRRFNFFNFRDHFRNGFQESPILTLLHNPEVTVRSRGVMEKCTFCVQRIADARSEAIRENRELKGTDVKTACQEACSTNAIQFGDINDKESDFHYYRNHELGYYVLEELNVKPNVTYIAKLRNIHPEDV